MVTIIRFPEGQPRIIKSGNRTEFIWDRKAQAGSVVTPASEIKPTVKHTEEPSTSDFITSTIELLSYLLTPIVGPLIPSEYPKTPEQVRDERIAAEKKRIPS